MAARRAAIRARLQRVCADRVIFEYALPRPLEQGLLGALCPGAAVRVQGFSALVAGAQDHARARGDGVEASGALGGSRLVVAYERRDGELPMRQIEALEGRLTQALDAPLCRQRQGSETASPLAPGQQVTRRR